MGMAAAVTIPALTSCSLNIAHNKPVLAHSLRPNSLSLSFRDSRLQTRSSRRRGVIRAGLPVVSSVPVLGPLANAVFNPVLLFIVYAAGAFRFYSGFRKTTYADSSATKISMTALWPVLFLASKAYRDNFKKAIS